MRSILTSVAALALASCGGADDAAVRAEGNGLALQDLSNVGEVDGVKPDAKVIRDRSVEGAWAGTVSGADAELSLGAGGRMSVRVMTNGSVSDVASGSWRWNDDGTISGDLSGGRRQLAEYTSWTAAFPGPGQMSFRGGSGSSATFSRGAAEVYGTAEEAAAAAHRSQVQ